MSAAVHDFTAYLDRENLESTACCWTIIYRRLWPCYERMEIAPRGSAEQYAGVDRFVHLPGGNVLACQEKTRDRDYDDLLVEYLHMDNVGRTWPGWIEHSQGADYLVYVQRVRGHVLCWRIADLRRTWGLNGARWIKTLRQHKAYNTGGYYSVNLAVPLPMLPHPRMVQVDPHIFRGVAYGK